MQAEERQNRISAAGHPDPDRLDQRLMAARTVSAIASTAVPSTTRSAGSCSDSDRYRQPAPCRHIPLTAARGAPGQIARPTRSARRPSSPSSCKITSNGAIGSRRRIDRYAGLTHPISIAWSLTDGRSPTIWRASMHGGGSRVFCAVGKDLEPLPRLSVEHEGSHGRPARQSGLFALRCYDSRSRR